MNTPTFDTSEKENEARDPRNFPFRAYYADLVDQEAHYEVIADPIAAYYAVRAHFRFPNLFRLNKESLELCEMAVLFCINDAAKVWQYVQEA